MCWYECVGVVCTVCVVWALFRKSAVPKWDGLRQSHLVHADSLFIDFPVRVFCLPLEIFDYVCSFAHSTPCTPRMFIFLPFTRMYTQVSVWRTILVANEWTELQSVRKTDIRFTLFFLGFVLLGEYLCCVLRHEWSGCTVHWISCLTRVCERMSFYFAPGLCRFCVNGAFRQTFTLFQAPCIYHTVILTIFYSHTSTHIYHI